MSEDALPGTGNRSPQGARPRPTIIEVARLAGVAPATVSRALHNPEIVTEPLRARVMAAVAACGYTTNLVARSLRTKETRSVTVLVADVTNPFFNEIIRGIEEVARLDGYSVLLADSENDPGHANAYGNLLVARRTDGMILLNDRMPEGLVVPPGDLRDPPIVAASGYIPNLDIPTIKIDDIGAAQHATQYLIGLGHRRIGFITGPIWNVLSRDRLIGYRNAMLATGPRFDEHLVATGDFSIESGIAATNTLLALSPEPTAIFASNDEMALGAMRAARRAGLQIPQDLSVIGFDDIRFAAHFEPPLTTVRQPGFEIGRQSMTYLAKILRGEPIQERRLILPTELIVRESTAIPR